MKHICENDLLDRFPRLGHMEQVLCKCLTM